MDGGSVWTPCWPRSSAGSIGAVMSACGDAGVSDLPVAAPASVVVADGIAPAERSAARRVEG